MLSSSFHDSSASSESGGLDAIASWPAAWSSASDALSFLLVQLIGRALGLLVARGGRQSLGS